MRVASGGSIFFSSGDPRGYAQYLRTYSMTDSRSRHDGRAFLDRAHCHSSSSSRPSIFSYRGSLSASQTRFTATKASAAKPKPLRASTT